MSITVADMIKRLEALNGNFVGGDLTKLAVEGPALEMLAMIKNRVRNEGRGTNGQDLRRYSTKPIYVTPDKFVKGGFRAQGKNNFAGNTIGDRLVPTARLKSNGIKKNPVAYSRYTLVKPNLQQRKSMYLADGYMQLRDIQGLRTDITNMSYSGQMLKDYKTERDGDTVVLGMTTKRSSDIYLGQTYGTSKMRGRGEFLQASPDEIAHFVARSTFLIRRLTTVILTGGEVGQIQQQITSGILSGEVATI